MIMARDTDIFWMRMMFRYWTRASIAVAFVLQMCWPRSRATTIRRSSFLLGRLRDDLAIGQILLQLVNNRIQCLDIKKAVHGERLQVLQLLQRQQATVLHIVTVDDLQVLQRILDIGQMLQRLVLHVLAALQNDALDGFASAKMLKAERHDRRIGGVDHTQPGRCCWCAGLQQIVFLDEPRLIHELHRTAVLHDPVQNGASKPNVCLDYFVINATDAARQSHFDLPFGAQAIWSNLIQTLPVDRVEGDSKQCEEAARLLSNIVFNSRSTALGPCRAQYS